MVQASSLTPNITARALKFRKDVDRFIGFHKELRYLELDDSEWESIGQVADWLKLFRAATTQMSTTKGVSMLSTTHAIFRGLQDHIANIFRLLPESTPQRIKTGLLDAHRKLSDYYYKFDHSPLYTWSACECFQSISVCIALTVLVLDPRISYDGIYEDYSDDPSLLQYLDEAMEELRKHYTANYARRADTQRAFPDQPQVHASSSAGDLSPSKVSFTSRYRRKDNIDRDELGEYFKLPREDWDHCNPLRWWVGRRTQFPCLFRLARDILTIPGSAVAVERVFSGGRDTISLRRASLQPETIRALMLVKQKVRICREP